MQVFRTAKPGWARTDDGLLSGEGAAKNPGRWNFAGEPTLYCAASMEVSLAEAGFYEIIANVIQLRSEGMVTDESYRWLLDRPRVLAEVEFSGLTDSLIDISDPEKFSTQSKKHSIQLTFAESRCSDLVKVNERTRRLASAIRKTGAAGMITRSARFEGNCVVIFPEQLTSRVSRNPPHRVDAHFSASNSGKRWSGKHSSRISESEIYVSHSLTAGESGQVIPVLMLP